MRTVLVLRALGLGDALTAVPALRGLRRLHPSAELVLATPPPVGEWLVGRGLADRVLPASGLRPLPWTDRPPDLAVNLHGRGPQSHGRLLELAPRRLLGFASPETGTQGPPWVEGEHEVDRWVRLVRSDGAECAPDDLVIPLEVPRAAHLVVHPGAAAPARRWPWRRWATVARSLSASGRRVVVTGSPTEADLCAAVASRSGAENRCGTDLPNLVELVSSASLVLCGDTGVAHLATAFRTPSVLLFGPVPPSEWGPRIDPDLHRVLWRPREGDRPGDPHGLAVDARLARITTAEVCHAADELLSTVGWAGPDGR